MGVRRASKHELAAEWQVRYWKGNRQERSYLLDEFVATTGYHRGVWWMRGELRERIGSYRAAHEVAVASTTRSTGS